MWFTPDLPRHVFRITSQKKWTKHKRPKLSRFSKIKELHGVTRYPLPISRGFVPSPLPVSLNCRPCNAPAKRQRRRSPRHAVELSWANWWWPGRFKTRRFSTTFHHQNGQNGPQKHIHRDFWGLTKKSESCTSNGRRFKPIKIGMPNNAKQYPKKDHH